MKCNEKTSAHKQTHTEVMITADKREGDGKSPPVLLFEKQKMLMVAVIHCKKRKIPFIPDSPLCWKLMPGWTEPCWMET